MRAVIAPITVKRHLVDGMQHPVDAKADGADVAPRLQVNVAGALVKRILPQPVDHLHHALVVGIELAIADWPSSTSCSKLALAEASLVFCAARTLLAPARRTPAV